MGEGTGLRFDGLRVAAVIDTPILSGVGRQLTALAGHIAAHGVELRIFTFRRDGKPESPFLQYLERAGIAHTILRDRGPRDLLLVRDLHAALRDWRPDILQTHSYRLTAMACLLRGLGVVRMPWAAFFHGVTKEDFKVGVYNRLERALLPSADRVVVMSGLQQRDFARFGDRVRVVYNAVVPLPEEDELMVLQSFRRPGVPLIGAVGRLSPEKGVDVLLDACAQSCKGGVQVTLIIAGDGPERESLQKHAARLRDVVEVHFLGNVRNVSALYRELDLVVIPSFSEGLPNVLLECLASDTPVVATTVGAIPEVLSDPGAGEMVPPGDATALVVAIARALQNGRSAAAQLARARAVSRFSIPRRVASHLALYAELRPDRLAQGSFPRAVNP